MGTREIGGGPRAGQPAGGTVGSTRSGAATPARRLIDERIKPALAQAQSFTAKLELDRWDEPLLAEVTRQLAAEGISFGIVGLTQRGKTGTFRVTDPSRLSESPEAEAAVDRMIETEILP